MKHIIHAWKTTGLHRDGEKWTALVATYPVGQGRTKKEAIENVKRIVQANGGGNIFEKEKETC